MLHCLRNSSSCHWRPPSWRHSTAERTAASRLLRTFSTMAGCCRCCGLPLTAAELAPQHRRAHRREQVAAHLLDDGGLLQVLRVAVDHHARAQGGQGGGVQLGQPRGDLVRPLAEMLHLALGGADALLQLVEQFRAAGQAALQPHHGHRHARHRHVLAALVELRHQVAQPQPHAGDVAVHTDHRRRVDAEHAGDARVHRGLVAAALVGQLLHQRAGLVEPGQGQHAFLVHRKSVKHRQFSSWMWDRPP